MKSKITATEFDNKVTDTTERIIDSLLNDWDKSEFTDEEKNKAKDKIENEKGILQNRISTFMWNKYEVIP